MSYIQEVKSKEDVKVSAMHRLFVAALLPLLLAIPAKAASTSDEAKTTTNRKGSTVSSHHAKTKKVSGYAPVNGLKMYYEVEGSGEPLVYIPPVFGFAGLKSFPTLTQSHKVITMDLQ